MNPTTYQKPVTRPVTVAKSKALIDAFNTLQPCCECRYSVPDGALNRCHASPPQVRMPYDNLSAWPVVPAKGGGCRLWKEVEV